MQGKCQPGESAREFPTGIVETKHNRSCLFQPFFIQPFNKLILVLDHEEESFLVALDKATGKELWRTPRDGRTNWTGPFVTTVNGRKQIVVSASREVGGYDLETGKKIWWATGLGQNTIPAPGVSNGVRVVRRGYGKRKLLSTKLGRGGC